MSDRPFDTPASQTTQGEREEVPFVVSRRAAPYRTMNGAQLENVR
jgi:hypothetical protein